MSKKAHSVVERSRNEVERSRSEVEAKSKRSRSEVETTLIIRQMSLRLRSVTTLFRHPPLALLLFYVNIHIPQFRG
jgi:hypothetical protein